MKKVYDFIDENKEKYIKLLQEISRQPSVAAQNRGIKETANMVEQYLQNISLQTEQVPTSGNPVVYGELNEGAKKTLAFYNHYDVQPEDPIDEWESDPFGAEIREGKIFGRGVADNKGSLLARICAVHAYKQVYGNLPINVKFIVEGEEEIGSPHLGEFAENNVDKIQADGCVWENGYKSTDGRVQIRLGVKGMLYVELRSNGANIDLHSSNGAIIENPAWRLVWALSTLKNEKEEVLIPGFYDNVDSLTPAERQLLEEMPFNEQELLDQYEVSGFVNNLQGTALKEKFIYQPTCTICGIESGYTGEGSKTVLPSKAKVKIDFRLVASQDPSEILKSLRKHLDDHGFNDIEIVSLKGQRAAKTAVEDPLSRVIIENAETFYGKKPQIMRTSAGTGPMYDLCQKYGIPAVGIGVGHEKSQQHAPNESIYVQDYIDGIKFVAQIMQQYAKTE